MGGTLGEVTVILTLKESECQSERFSQNFRSPSHKVQEVCRRQPWGVGGWQGDSPYLCPFCRENDFTFPCFLYEAWYKILFEKWLYYLTHALLCFFYRQKVMIGLLLLLYFGMPQGFSKVEGTFKTAKRSFQKEFCWEAFLRQRVKGELEMGNSQEA